MKRNRRQNASGAPSWPTAWPTVLTISLVPASLAAGCTDGAEDRTPVAAVTVDLRESRPMEQLNSRVLVDTEDLLAGSALSEVTGGRLVDGTSVALADRLNHRVVLIPLDGSEPTTFGRSGQGPGEFLAVDGLSAAADPDGDVDRLYVWDGRNARMTSFPPGDGSAATATVSPDPLRTAQRGLPFLGVFPDGSFPLPDREFGIPEGPVGEIIRPPMTVSHYSHEGEWLGYLYSGSGGDMFKWEGEQGRRTAARPPLGRELLTTFSGDRIWILDSHDGNVTWVDGDGRRGIWQIIREATERPSEAHRDTWIRDLTRGGGSAPGGMLEGFGQIWAEAPLPRQLPVARHWVGTTNGIWMGAWEELGSSTVRWYAMDRDGRLLGHLELGREEQILDADQGLAVIRSLDGLGRASIRVVEWAPGALSR